MPADPIAAFFEALGRREHDPALQRARGSVAVEVGSGRARRRWLLAFDKGNVTVSRKTGAADVTMRADAETFRQLATGRKNPTAEVLRGTVTVDGNPRLLVLFQRIFPGPPRRRRR
jgi:hypothetical protein